MKRFLIKELIPLIIGYTLMSVIFYLIESGFFNES